MNLPSIADPDLKDKLFTCGHEPERLVGRLLPNVGPEFQRGRQRETAESDVSDIGLALDLDTHQHVRPRQDNLVRQIPDDAGGQTCRLKAHRSQYMPEQDVLFVAVAAPAAMDQLLLQRRGIQIHGPSKQWIQIFKGDRLGMPEVERFQGIERRCL